MHEKYIHGCSLAKWQPVFFADVSIASVFFMWSISFGNVYKISVASHCEKQRFCLRKAHRPSVAVK